MARYGEYLGGGQLAEGPDISELLKRYMRYRRAQRGVPLGDQERERGEPDWERMLPARVRAAELPPLEGTIPGTEVPQLTGDVSETRPRMKDIKPYKVPTLPYGTPEPDVEAAIALGDEGQLDWTLEPYSVDEPLNKPGLWQRIKARGGEVGQALADNPGLLMAAAEMFARPDVDEWGREYESFGQRAVKGGRAYLESRAAQRELEGEAPLKGVLSPQQKLAHEQFKLGKLTEQNLQNLRVDTFNQRERMQASAQMHDMVLTNWANQKANSSELMYYRSMLLRDQIQDEHALQMYDRQVQAMGGDTEVADAMLIHGNALSAFEGLTPDQLTPDQRNQLRGQAIELMKLRLGITETKDGKVYADYEELRKKAPGRADTYEDVVMMENDVHRRLGSGVIIDVPGVETTEREAFTRVKPDLRAMEARAAQSIVQQAAAEQQRGAMGELTKPTPAMDKRQAEIDRLQKIIDVGIEQGVAAGTLMPEAAAIHMAELEIRRSGVKPPPGQLLKVGSKYAEWDDVLGVLRYVEGPVRATGP